VSRRAVDSDYPLVDALPFETGSVIGLEKVY
jgi:hypothetical protein